MLLAIFRRSRTDDRYQAACVLGFQKKVSCPIAVILAPHSLGLLAVQSDFGRPAGTVFADMIVSDFPQIWFVARVAASIRCCGPGLRRHNGMTWETGRCRRAASSGSIQPQATGSSS